MFHILEIQYRNHFIEFVHEFSVFFHIGGQDTIDDTFTDNLVMLFWEMGEEIRFRDAEDLEEHCYTIRSEARRLTHRSGNSREAIGCYILMRGA